ncbi:Intraflagellar transport protein 80, partial [Perkinsus chesapeaki]
SESFSHYTPSGPFSVPAKKVSHEEYVPPDEVSNQTMYSCGSLAPKTHLGHLKKKSPGGGCMNCSSGDDRYAVAWERSDGAVDLLASDCLLRDDPGELLDTFMPTVESIFHLSHFKHNVNLKRTICERFPLLRSAAASGGSAAAMAAARMVHPVDGLFMAASTLQKKAPEVPAEKELADLAVSAERALQSDPRRFVDISHCVAGIVPQTMLQDYRKVFSSTVIEPFLTVSDSSIGLSDDEALAVFLVAAELGILRGTDNVEVTAALSKRVEKMLPTADAQLLLSCLGPVRKADASLARKVVQELLTRAPALEPLQLASLGVGLSGENEEIRHTLLAEIDSRLSGGDNLPERDLVDLIIASLRLDPSNSEERRPVAAQRLASLLLARPVEEGSNALAGSELEWAADAATLIGNRDFPQLAELLVVNGQKAITTECALSPMLVDLAVSISRGIAVTAPPSSPFFTVWMQHLCSAVITPTTDLRLVLRLAHGLQGIQQGDLQWGLTWDFIAQTLLGRPLEDGQVSDVMSVVSFAADHICTELPQDALEDLAQQITSPRFVASTNIHSLALIAINCVKLLQQPTEFLSRLVPTFKGHFLKGGLPPATVCLVLSAYGRALGPARQGATKLTIAAPLSFAELHDAAAVALLDTKIPFTQQQCHIMIVTRSLMNPTEESSPAFTALVGKILLSAVSTNPPTRDSETTLGLLKGLRAGSDVEQVLIDAGLVTTPEDRGKDDQGSGGREGAEARMKATFKKAVSSASAARGAVDLSNVKMPDPNESWWQTVRRRWILAMRLAVRHASSPIASHDGICTGVVQRAANPQGGSAGEILSAGDDGKIIRWHEKDVEVCKTRGKLTQGTSLGDLCTVDSHITAMAAHRGDETVVVGCSDGTIRFINSTTGKEERRTQQTHKGSVTYLRWDHDGQLLCSCGEDGTVKVWSKNGMIRSQLAQVSTAVICAAWSPDSETLAFSCLPSLHLKTLVAGRGLIQWKAVESGTSPDMNTGEILCLDWSPVTRLIVSGGEDCRYRIWEATGQLLYCSEPFEHPVTSVRWTPNGKFLAVGACGAIKLCDASGWAYSFTHLPGLQYNQDTLYDRAHVVSSASSGSSSPFSLCWASDGTRLTMGMGDGTVITADVVGRCCSWLNVEAVMTDANTVVVKDHLAATTEEIDFNDRVTDLSIGYGHLVVTTASQCFIYNRHESADKHETKISWVTSPIVEEIKEPTSLIVQCNELFCLVDTKGMGVYPYDRKNRLSYLRPPTQQRLDFLTEKTVTISKDTLVYVDPSRPRNLCIFDLLSPSGGSSGGKGPMVLSHSTEITQIGLSQTGEVADRKLAFLDKNSDLWITAGYPQYISFRGPTGDDRMPKLKAMVSSFRWNDRTDILVATADQQMITWNYPQCAFSDAQAANLTTEVVDIPRSSAGPDNGPGSMSDAVVESFIGTRVTLQRSYGGKLVLATSPYPPLLYKLQSKGHWDKAVKLCRYVQMKELWATLAAMAMKANDAGGTLETALAAISDVCKISMLRHAKAQADPIVRQAEIMLLSRRANEAIQLLVANKKIYRAIKFNIWLHRWEAALDLAVHHRTHVDTVLAYRMRHLEAMNHAENNEKFRRYAAEVPVDWEAIKTKIAREKADERTSNVNTPVNQSATSIPLEMPSDITADYST